MTPEEFKAWMKETESSKAQWIIDPVHLNNDGEVLAYRGGAAGTYLTISAEGKLDIGRYTDAIPHIGEAAFRSLYTRQYASFGAALSECIERGGMSFLMAVLGIKAPAPAVTLVGF